MTTPQVTDPFTTAVRQMTQAFQIWQPKAASRIPLPTDLPVQLIAAYVSDVQEICTDAFEKQRALFAEGAMSLAERMPGLLASQQPQDLTELQLESLVAAVEASSRRAGIWAEMSKRLGDRYAALAHEVACELDNVGAAAKEAPPEATVTAVKAHARKAG